LSLLWWSLQQERASLPPRLVLAALLLVWQPQQQGQREDSPRAASLL